MAEDESSTSTRITIDQISAEYLDTSIRRMSKRIQEPTTVDFWLEGMGYFRKHTPKDPTCLFRAVSEQLYHTQYYHIKVRKECVKFMKAIGYLFEESVTIPYDHYLEQMACFTEWGSTNEIRAMSLLYERDIIIFNAQKQTVENVTNNGFESNLLLCYTPPKQYETVYTIHYIQIAAYCQSVIYEVLYKNVFNMTNIMTTAHKMLHDRSTVFRHDKFFQKGNLDIREQLTTDLYNKLESEYNNTDEMQSDSKGLPPIPYKAAKALNPDIYRNTDFDIWHELRREVKYAGWSRHNNNELQVGGKCLINPFDLDENRNNNNSSLCDTDGSNVKNLQQKWKQENFHYSGYVQEMGTGEDPVLVFIENLGEKRLVPYGALKPFPLVKRNKQNNSITHNKKNAFIDTGRRWRKTYNSSSRKRKETINTANGTINNINKNGLINNMCDTDKTDLETECNIEPPKVDQPQTSENYSAQATSEIFNLSETVMLDNLQSVKTKSIAQEIGEGRKKTNTNFTKHNVNNGLLKKPARSVVSNNHDNFQNMYSKPKMDESYYINPSHNDNSQTNIGVNPNLLFYVLPDGTSYPVFLPGNFADLDQMDHLMPPRLFYNLGLEYFRVNQTWNYGGAAFGPDHNSIQSFGPASPNANINNAPYVQEEVARLVNGMHNCSLTYNEGYNGNGKDTSAEPAISKNPLPNINNVQNTKHLKQGSSKAYGSRDSSYHFSERRYGTANKGNKGNKPRQQLNTQEPLTYMQHWSQYGAPIPASNSGNTYDSRIITHMQQQQHLDQMTQQQQAMTAAVALSTNPANGCAPYASLPTTVFPGVPFYSNEAAVTAAAEACCNPYYLTNGGFIPVTCLPPPSSHHNITENGMGMPLLYPPSNETYPPYSPVSSYPASMVCPPTVFPSPQMQFPPILQQQSPPTQSSLPAQPPPLPPSLPPPPPLPTASSSSNMQEHWYTMLAQPSHYMQYTTPSTPIITDSSCNGQASGPA